MNKKHSEKEKFEEHAKKHVYYNKNEKYKINKSLKKLINKFDNKIKMLDIGAGDGNLAIKLRDIKKIQLTVSDISKTRIERIKKITKNKLYKYIVDDINNSKLKNNSYDLINSDMTIEHVPSDIKMLKKIKYLLKSNGRFRITTIFRNKIHFWVYINNNQFVIDPTHVREYESIREIKNLFKKSGLKINSIEITPLYFYPLRKLNQIIKFKFFNKIKIQKPGYYSITIIGEKDNNE